MAPDAAAILGENDLVSAVLGAATTGMHTFQLLPDPMPGQPDRHNTLELMDALRAFVAG